MTAEVRGPDGPGQMTVRYPMPSRDQHPLTGTLAPDLTLHTDQGTTSVAQLMATAWPVFLAWSAVFDEPASTAAPALGKALSRWFGRSEPTA